MIKKLFFVGLVVMMLFAPIKVKAENNIKMNESCVQEITITRADVIVTYFREYHGIKQYRRWNETRGYWVDSDWIDLP